MSQRITITIPDEHYDWLEDVMKRRGWDSVQGAVRSLIEDNFRLDKKIGAASQSPTPIGVGMSCEGYGQQGDKEA